MIKNISDIQRLLVNGFDKWSELGNVSVQNNGGGLFIFNYSNAAQFEARWNYFELVSRGLIIDSKTGEIVARPFDKFFNWGEGGRESSTKIKTVTEKLDGSLGILYSHNNIATRGSFNSEQAIWATSYLQQNYNLNGLNSDLTLLLEIIYPDNRIVVDYNGREDLVLLAARNRFTGEYATQNEVNTIANKFGFSLPTIYNFRNVDEIIRLSETLDANTEGWVVEFEDGQRFKFKGDEYRKLHRLVCSLSLKNIIDAMENGLTDKILESVPDEFLGEVKLWMEQIANYISKTEQAVDSALSNAPRASQKDFALWVLDKHNDLATYLFSRAKGEPIRPMIYKSIRKNKSMLEEKNG